MSDELDDWDEDPERAEAREESLEGRLALADAAQLDDFAAEQDETHFDETRHAYSGVEEGDGDVDRDELEEAGALFDAPERDAPRTDISATLDARRGGLGPTGGPRSSSEGRLTLRPSDHRTITRPSTPLESAF